MHFHNAVLAALTAASALATPIDSLTPRQISVNLAEVANFATKLGEVRASITQQLQQVMSEPIVGQISGQFNLGEQLNRLNQAGNEINGAIEAIQGSLRSATDQYSTSDKDAAGRVANRIFA